MILGIPLLTRHVSIHQKFNAKYHRTFKLLFDNLSDEIFLKLNHIVFLLMTNGTAVVLILTKNGVHLPKHCITCFCGRNGPGWSANITRIRSWTFQNWWFNAGNRCKPWFWVRYSQFGADFHSPSRHYYNGITIHCTS